VTGGDVNDTVNPDPLIDHFRKQNSRLQRRTDELEDEVKNLNEALNERNNGRKNSRDTDDRLSEKLRVVCHEHAVEKKQ
jgi:exonuclease VII small subunit